MGLRLLSVQPRQGWRWVTQGVRLWWRHPLAFSGLLALFLLAVTLIMVLVPWVGGIIGLCMVPLLSLGFMVASRSALQGGPVHALQLVEGLRHPQSQQLRAQLLICLAYGVTTMMVIALADLVDGGLFEDFQRALSRTGPDGKADPQLMPILLNPMLYAGMAVRLGLTSLLSIPFWHAPALVHWGGQTAMQALFSSTLALWRTRAAFALYMVGWITVVVSVAVLLTILATLVGMPRIVVGLTMPIALPLTAAFYVSLWFSFVDTFGTPDPVTTA
jgi:hypothetical protein